MRRQLFFSIITGIYLLAFFRFDTWPTSVLCADALGYYLHLPAGFIYRDLGDYSKSLSTWRQSRYLGRGQPVCAYTQRGLRPYPCILGAQMGKK